MKFKSATWSEWEYETALPSPLGQQTPHHDNSQSFGTRQRRLQRHLSRQTLDVLVLNAKQRQQMSRTYSVQCRNQSKRGVVITKNLIINESIRAQCQSVQYSITHYLIRRRLHEPTTYKRQLPLGARWCTMSASAAQLCARQCSDTVVWQSGRQAPFSWLWRCKNWC